MTGSRVYVSGLRAFVNAGMQWPSTEIYIALLDQSYVPDVRNHRHFADIAAFEITSPYERPKKKRRRLEKRLGPVTKYESGGNLLTGLRIQGADGEAVSFHSEAPQWGPRFTGRPDWAVLYDRRADVLLAVIGGYMWTTDGTLTVKPDRSGWVQISKVVADAFR